MSKNSQKPTDEQAERKARILMLIIGVVAFSFGVFLKMTAKDNAVAWPELVTVLMELVAWPFWIGGFVFVLFGLGMKTGKE